MHHHQLKIFLHVKKARIGDINFIFIGSRKSKLKSRSNLYKFWFLYPLLFGVKLRRTVFDRTEHHLSVCVRLALARVHTNGTYKAYTLFLLSKKNLVKNLWCDSLKFPPKKLFLPLQKVANSSHPEPLLMSESSDNVLNLKFRQTTRSKITQKWRYSFYQINK